MSKKFALLVEDNDDLRASIKHELADITEYVIIDAKDGVQAYQKTRNQKFEVIVSELNIKKLNGAQLIAAARETNLNINTPFIILTNNLDEAKKQTRGQAGISFLQKPADIQVLSEMVLNAKPLDNAKKKFKLDVDFINPFIESAMKTLNSLCGVNHIEAQKPYLLAENEILDIDISGVLAITSPYFRGSIAISFNDKVYKTVVGKMIEENVESISIDNEDGVAEIINIIFGQTKAVLNKEGYSLDRAIPTVTKGHGHKILQDSKIPILLVPFNSDLGNFWIQICVKAI